MSNRVALAVASGYLAGLAAVLVYIGTHFPVPDLDVYWHILAGLDVMQGDLSAPSASTVLGDSGWRTTEAAFEVVLAALFTISGSQGISWFVALAVSAVLLSLLWLAFAVTPRRQRSSAALTAAFIATVVTIPIAWNGYLQARAYPFTIAAYAVLAVLAYRMYATGRWPRWWVMAGFTAVWVNLHGGALLAAPLLVAVFAARQAAISLRVLPRMGSLGREVRDGFIGVAAAVGGTLVNPFGVEIYAMAFHLRQVVSDYVYEWREPDVVTLVAWVPVLAIGFVLILFRKPRGLRLPLAQLGFVIPIAAVSSTTNRTLVTALVLVSPVLVRPLSSLFSGRVEAGGVTGRQFGFLGLAVATGAAGVAAATVAYGNAPWTIIRGLDDGASRQVLAPARLGGSISFSSSTAVPFLDGRLDRYGAEALLAESQRLSSDLSVVSEGQDFFLNAGATDVITSNPVEVDLLTNEGWSPVCLQGDWVWLSRIGGSCEGEPERRVPITE